MRKKRRALFIGRFQPYHAGHHWVVKRLACRFDEVLIVIGSTQVNRTRDNPLTVKERKILIRTALRADGLEKKCRVFELKDKRDNEKWLRALLALCPRFDEAFSNHALTLKLLREKGFTAHETGLWRGISATLVRLLVRENNARWKKLVHPAVAKELEARGLVNAIRKSLKPSPKPVYCRAA
ncbi:MAG: adenylyltransferase/cytidyltransferase family protein [Candidatus Norongarragalinales archaeon]